MAQEIERTISFMQNSSSSAGFPKKDYDQPIADAVKSGKPKIELEHSSKSYPDGSNAWFFPQLTVQPDNPERYNFGYKAIIEQPDKSIAQQFFTSYNTYAPTLDQAKELLRGGTVVAFEWDNDIRRKKDVILKLDLSKPVKEGENHPIQKVNAADVAVGILYSKENIVAKPPEKNQQLLDLQQGKQIDVKIQEFPDGPNGRPQYTNVSLKFNLVHDEKGPRLAMDVRDREGVLLRSPSVDVKVHGEIKGLKTGPDKENKLPEHIAKLLAFNKKEQGQQPTLTPQGTGRTPKRA